MRSEDSRLRRHGAAVVSKNLKESWNLTTLRGKKRGAIEIQLIGRFETIPGTKNHESLNSTDYESFKP